MLLEYHSCKEKLPAPWKRIEAAVIGQKNKHNVIKLKNSKSVKSMSAKSE